MSKKLLFVLAILTAFSFMACSSDKDDEIILAGTTWENSNTSGKATLSFQNTTFDLEGNYDMDGDGSTDAKFQSKGTYAIENTTLHLTANGFNADCQIDNNTIVFPETEYTNAIVFYRK